MKLIKSMLYLLLMTVLIVTIALLGFGLYNKRVAANSDSMVQGLTSDGVKEFTFSFKEDSTVMEYVSPSSNTKSIPMQLDATHYVIVNIPSDIQYCTDFSTYIYDVNGTFKVTKVIGVDPYNLEKSVGMVNTTKLGPAMLADKKDKAKEWQVAKALVDDVAIIASVRGNSIAYATIESSLFNNPVQTMDTVPQFDTSSNNRILSMNTAVLPTEARDGSEVFDTQVQFSESGVPGQANYVYEKSFLSSFNLLYQYDEAINIMKRRVAMIKEGDLTISQELSDTSYLYFIQSGDVYVLIIPISYNQSYALLGYGKEAGYNIIQYGKVYQAYLNKSHY